jgi:hypothetical protein
MIADSLTSITLLVAVGDKFQVIYGLRPCHHVPGAGIRLLALIRPPFSWPAYPLCRATPSPPVSSSPRPTLRLAFAILYRPSSGARSLVTLRAWTTRSSPSCRVAGPVWITGTRTTRASRIGSTTWLIVKCP